MMSKGEQRMIGTAPGAAVLVGWLTACGVSVQGYQEAPMLAERVARGELPPVAERLPEKPVVVMPVESIGKYGGTWRRLSLGGRDIQLDYRMGYEPLVRWDLSGKKAIPGLAESWEIQDGGKTYVFRLRKGLKWSDGEPLTSADFLFTHQDVLGNKELYPVFPAWLTVGGVAAAMTAPDPQTIVYRFAKPYGVFLEVLAYRGALILGPEHYLKRFHPKYVDKRKLEKQVHEAGFDLWNQLFLRQFNPNENPDLPTWKPFKIVVPPPGSRMIAERNPYYWKVDPAGNQLPYIDRVAFTDVQNNEIVTMKAMAGEVDFQARRIDAGNYGLFMENREAGNYRVLRDANPSTTCLYLNQYSKDPVMRKLLQDRRFRVALSLAVDRRELIFLMYSGMAVPARGVASPYDPYYLPEFDAKYLEYDPVEANRLLDEVGLRRGRTGERYLPDGRPFRQILHVYPSEAGTSTDLWQLVAEYYREVGLDFVVKVDAGTLSVMQISNGNLDFWAYAETGMHWVLDPRWYVPTVSTAYFAPLYGQYYASGGKKGVKPPEEWQRILDWYAELTTVVGDDRRKLELGRNILRQWAEECYVIGICRNDLLTIVSNDFKNVPERIIHDWRVMTPGYIGIEQFYIDSDRTTDCVGRKAR
ncbi:MAG: ABC transporter substrate-binding protein [Phycisphaerae bacterium]|nr:ABC transporter substrate-binding protein [Phycisphaerae bacterium]